jgi:hypothetical protein
VRIHKYVTWICFFSNKPNPGLKISYLNHYKLLQSQNFLVTFNANAGAYADESQKKTGKVSPSGGAYLNP